MLRFLQHNWLWALALLPAVAAAYWTSTTHRLSPEKLFMVTYRVKLSQPISAAQWFGDPRSPNATPGVLDPGTGNDGIPKHLLETLGVSFPPASYLAMGNSQSDPFKGLSPNEFLTARTAYDPDQDFTSSFVIYMGNTLESHARFHALLRAAFDDPEVQNDFSPSMEVEYPRPRLSGNVAQLGDLPFGIEEAMQWRFEGTKPRVIRRTYISLGESAYQDTTSLSDSLVSFSGMAMNYRGPMWPAVFLLLVTPVVFVWLLRRPLTRAFRRRV